MQQIHKSKLGLSHIRVASYPHTQGPLWALQGATGTKTLNAEGDRDTSMKMRQLESSLVA